jgi:putative heme-binding domain-containing protein
LRLRAAQVALALNTEEDPPERLMSLLLDEADPTYRAWAYRSLGNSGASNAMWQQVKERLSLISSHENRTSRDELLQLAIAAGTRAPADDKMGILLKVLSVCGDDKLIPHIVWQNLYPLLEERADEFVSAIDTDATKKPAVASIIPRAMERMLSRKKFDAQPIAKLFKTVHDWSPTTASECSQLLADRVQSGEIRGERYTQLREAFLEVLPAIIASQEKDSLRTDAAILNVTLGDARGMDLVQRSAVNRSVEPALRLRALSALIAWGDFTTVFYVADASLSNSGDSREFAGQALALLAKLDQPNIASFVLRKYPSLAPELQPKAIELLTQRAMWAKPLVEEIGAGKIPASALNVNQIQRLLALKDAELTAAVNKYWGTIRTTRDPNREKLAGEMRKLIRSTKGDPHRGIEIFNRVCGQCHKIYGQGQDVGPDITANGRASFEQLLSNVFDPSLVIGAIYQPRVVQAADGRIITGLLVEDSPQRVVLKVQGGKLETIAREDVEAMKTSELSLMPEGLEKQLKPQEIADLFAFITLDKHPDDPTAKAIPSGADGKK